MSSAGSVTGVRGTLKVLRQTDTDLYWACVNSIKDAARPMAAAIDQAFPQDAPLSGFAHAGRTGWMNTKKTNVKFGGRRSRTNVRNQEWPLVRIQVTDAPRQIFDMAGAANDGNPLDTSLKKANWGRASRSVWRVAPELMKDADRAIKQACRVTVSKVNAKLTVIR